MPTRRQDGARALGHALHVSPQKQQHVPHRRRGALQRAQPEGHVGTHLHAAIEMAMGQRMAFVIAGQKREIPVVGDGGGSAVDAARVSEVDRLRQLHQGAIPKRAQQFLAEILVPGVDVAEVSAAMQKDGTRCRYRRAIPAPVRVHLAHEARSPSGFFSRSQATSPA